MSSNESERPRWVTGVRRRLLDDAVQLTCCKKTIELDANGCVVWDLCDGTRTVADIAETIVRRLRLQQEAPVADVRRTVETLAQEGFVSLEPGPTLAPETVEIDLRKLRSLVINCEGEEAKWESMDTQLRGFGMQPELVPGVPCDPPSIGIGLSHLKILQRSDLSVPFAVFEDDCVFEDDFDPSFRVPEGVDALYLGVSHFGIPVPGEFGWGRWEATRYHQYSEHFLRVFNMLARHAIVFLTEAFREAVRDGAIAALTNHKHVYAGDIAYAMTHSRHLVLTPALPACYQAERFGGHELATRVPLGVSVSDPHKPNDLEIKSKAGRGFFLFLDIFVHWDRKKITAVAPYYGDDLDLAEAGVDFDQVYLVFGQHSVVGRCIRYRLDSWEPCIVFDFEHPELEFLIEENPTIDVQVFAGRLHKRIILSCKPEKTHETAVSLVVRDQNRWLPYYLEYYLNCLEVDHVYLYDNGTRDQIGIRDVVDGYRAQGRLTYVPWNYRWRNRIDGKQIGQPPQQVHCLNKYGGTRWIGFFDYDEFLRLPGQTAGEFLAAYDHDTIGGVSFGLRWFVYRGDKSYEQVGNPLLEFLYSKRDSLGRKRQKLFVSPRNVRFMRFHWIQEDQIEVQVEDDEVFFHHYYLNPERFAAGKDKSGLVRDDYMLEFDDRFDIARPPTSSIKHRPEDLDAWVRHVSWALHSAETQKSRLSPEVISVEGMCGAYTRHFYNNLCGFKGCRYLEVGSWQGASVCSASFGNRIEAFCVDNWSEFNERDTKAEFEKNTKRFCAGSSLTLFESDCFALDTSALPPIDVFLYDGEHSEDSQYRAVEYFCHCLADIAVLIIDDWNWVQVRQGAGRAIADLGLDVHLRTEIILPESDTLNMPNHKGKNGWWNGIGVFLVSRPGVVQ